MQLQDYGIGLSLEDCKIQCLKRFDCTNIKWAPWDFRCIAFEGCQNVEQNSGWHHYVREGK